jgi:hypothetical protein
MRDPLNFDLDVLFDNMWDLKAYGRQESKLIARKLI